MSQASEKKVPVKAKKITGQQLPVKAKAGTVTASPAKGKKVAAGKLLVKETKTAVKATVRKSAAKDTKKVVAKLPVKTKKATAKELPAKKVSAPKAPRKKAVSKALQPNDTVLQMLQMIQKSLDADKAEEINTIDLRGKTTIADYMVIANGGSSRQLVAMAEHLASKCKSEFKRTVSIEGKGESDWVLLDTGDIIVHLFRAEMRRFYNLEKMWTGDLPTDLLEDSLENQVLRHRARKKSL